MLRYRYLIIGGGMAADAAVRGIRQIDGDGTIGLVSREAYAPYRRPPLSKGLWLGKPRDRIWLNTEGLGATLHLERTVTALDLPDRSAVDDQGTVYRYDKLMIATGGEPRRFLFGGDDIIYFRTFADYLRLWELAETHRRFAVIGGGFIGSEIAAALSLIGKDVTMAFPEPGIGSRVFPHALSESLTRYFADRGVAVLSGHTLTSVSRADTRLTLSLCPGEAAADKVIAAEAAVAGIGIDTAVALAEQAGLRVDNGVLVDEFLCTSAPDVYAAGDVANFYNPALDERMRVEHEDNAVTMGRIAGANMAGAAERYHHLPYFYSDLFDLGYEAVGRLDSGMETVEDWRDPYRKGVVYYLHDRRVRGVLLWNLWDRVAAARSLIAQRTPVRPENLRGLL